MTRFQRDRQGTGLARAGARRTPRGSVLILVMAILGILFVTGVAFLMTMNFEARLIRSGERAGQEEAGVDRIEQVTGALLKGEFVTVPGVLVQLTWAELPVVHGLISQIEPYTDANFNRVFGYVTDFKTLHGSVFNQNTIARNKVNTFLYVGEHVDPADLDDPIVVDADGDGIVDTLQVNLSDMNFSRSQLADISKAVNDPSHSSEKVYLGLRVIPHGAMVDLDDSHPNLIAEAMDVDRDSERVRTRMQRPYSPTAEEASLRRRFFIPPRVVPSSAVQGNPADQTNDPSAGGDFGSRLFWPKDPPVFPDQQTVRTGEHRYWPFSRHEDNDEWESRWTIRLNPRNNTQYDRRHLVTTISHDDNLMRGAHAEHRDKPSSQFRRVDVLELMTEAVLNDLPDNYPCESDASFRFQYVAYPHTLVSGYYTKAEQELPPWDDYSKGDPLNWCECERRKGRPYEDCSHDLRKGRLRLSLPWLDTAVADGWINTEQRKKLIQEAFLMLLLNARSEAGNWGFFDPLTNQWKPDWRAMSLGAASLTANMIDFMDEDDDPTKIEVRWFDFNDDNWVNETDRDAARVEWLQNIGKATCELESYTWTYPPPDTSDPIECQHVYGLERQPFITEVAAYAEENPPGTFLPAESFFGVELFNPYDRDIVLDGRYALHFTSNPMDPSNTLLIHLPGSLPAGAFVGFYSAGDGVFNQEDVFGANWLGTVVRLEPPDPEIGFAAGATIYLVRIIDVTDEVVVDQFDLTGSDVAKWETAPVLRSIERVADLGSRWTATLPVDASNTNFQQLYPTFGMPNNAGPPSGIDMPPVEVLFANTNAFATAFPTTGSLLLLMRHANHPVTDPSDVSTGAAFTSFLAGDYPVDNGRMPVFDANTRHHMDPAATPEFTPGELMYLPWGQLVFDYFTALPLSNWGPYRDPDGVQENAKPRVDLEGLRVHGRINLNAAPWKVLAGLPFVPMEDIPDAFRATFSESLGLMGTPEDEASKLGEELAKAIVAYREARGLGGSGLGSSFQTGDYDTERGWTADSPAARRGTGFMAVGELANVRAADPLNNPDYRKYRIDSGYLEVGSDSSYLKAIAVLACLGDWVTVRSHVFTIYGVLRGQEDETIVDPDPVVQNRLRAAEVDSRALRFQETVDRLPTFLGEQAPLRVGDRTVSKYRDTLND